MDLRELIAQSFGAEAAEEWNRATVDEDDKRKLLEAARKVLQMFPGRTPSACCLMSAVYSLVLKKMELRTYVVAGSLYVGDTRIFGEDGELDGKTRFSQTDMSWDGHAWIVYGDWLADVSVCRTADSDKSHPALKAQIHHVLGAGKGLLACKIESAIKDGLRYEPRYVLAQDQVDALGRGAQAMFSGHGSR